MHGHVRQRRKEVGVPLATPELAKVAREEEVLVCRRSGRMRSPYRRRCSLLGRKELADYPPLATTPRVARRRSLSRCRCRKLGGSLPAFTKLYRPLWLLTRLPGARRGAPAEGGYSQHHRSRPRSGRPQQSRRSRMRECPPLAQAGKCPSLVCCVARRSAARCSPLDGEPLGARRSMGAARCSPLDGEPLATWKPLASGGFKEFSTHRPHGLSYAWG
ncbi:hypothetical protein Dimus_015052 [Dionaea muscipula]